MKQLKITWPINLIQVRRVNGSSMAPNIKDGQIALFTCLIKPSNNKIVLYRHDEIEYIKRLRVSKKSWDLYGDNYSDSRDFLHIEPTDIRGVLVLPRR